MVKMNIAIILARGGSKRIPNKNILPLAGRPMLAWSIKAALESKKFSRVLVSTDCEKIAEIARQYGASAPFLRNRAYGDNASSSEATIAALHQAEQFWEEDYHVVAQLMANCPMRTSSDICSAFDAFCATQAPSQISCFKFGWMNPWWAARLDESGRPIWLFPEVHGKRSQDLADLFCPTGALWLSRKPALLASQNYYMPGHIFHEISWLSAIDIDNHADLAMAEMCMSLRHASRIGF